MEIDVLAVKVLNWLENHDSQTTVLEIAHQADWDYYEDVGFMASEFNRYFRDWEPYDIVSSLSCGFTSSDLYFQENGEIYSSDELTDLIDYARLSEKIADALLHGERFEVDENIDDLYELVKEEKKERTPEEIKAKVEELFNDEFYNIAMIYTILSDSKMYGMYMFVEYMREFPIDHLSYLFAGIVNHAFAFNFDYFTEEEHELVAWDREQVVEYLLTNIDELQNRKDKLPESLATILNGEWEDE